MANTMAIIKNLTIKKATKKKTSTASSSRARRYRSKPRPIQWDGSRWLNL